MQAFYVSPEQTQELLERLGLELVNRGIGTWIETQRDYDTPSVEYVLKISSGTIEDDSQFTFVIDEIFNDKEIAK